MPPEILAIVTARNEGERIGATLDGLALAFPGVSVWVADDGSTDDTAAIAAAAGARVVRGERPVGKGGAATAAARDALAMRRARRAARGRGDGGRGSPSAMRVRRAGRDSFVASATAIWASRHARSTCSQQRSATAAPTWPSRSSPDGSGEGSVSPSGSPAARSAGAAALEMTAPISGQRALSEAALADMLPFAPGFGMETGMTIDAVRAGRRVVEIELDLSHRATGRTLGGFVHRGRQLLDIMRAQAARA